MRNVHEGEAIIGKALLFFWLKAATQLARQVQRHSWGLTLSCENPPLGHFRSIWDTLNCSVIGSV